jgi:hypothetical protein
VVRSNGSRYRVQSRLRRVSIDRRDGLRSVKLATGRAGRYRTIYPARLVAELFGDNQAAAA